MQRNILVTIMVQLNPMKRNNKGNNLGTTLLAVTRPAQTKRRAIMAPKILEITPSKLNHI